MILDQVTFKRKFAFTAYKNRKISLGEMTFTKDFVTDRRGDLYPVLDKSNDCVESVIRNQYHVKCGNVTRWIAQFFPYATYEMTAQTMDGKCGFCFTIPQAQAKILVNGTNIFFSVDNLIAEQHKLPDWLREKWTLLVSCRPGAFDIFFECNGAPTYFHTFCSDAFEATHNQNVFTNSSVSVYAEGNITISETLSYLDCGGSQADMRPIRYENGEVMIDRGKIYFTMTVRMYAKSFQAVFSWMPGTAELEMTGALFFDAGDGYWNGNVASSILYHRKWNKWLLWVCAFSHGHIPAHSSFDGDPRFGINVIDIEVIKKAPEGSPVSVFAGIQNDEDPDFFYDEQQDKWYLAICRMDRANRKDYRYVFFESKDPFEGYTFLGQGLDGAETGGSFVKVQGEQLFLCGNDYKAKSDYRIYSKEGMTNAKFDLPDGGFRGWGTLIPVKQGSRTRYYWFTFDRHNCSDFNWSYGNLYCFEGML